jgi:hypothetical protein
VLEGLFVDEMVWFGLAFLFFFFKGRLSLGWIRLHYGTGKWG